MLDILIIIGVINLSYALCGGSDDSVAEWDFMQERSRGQCRQTLLVFHRTASGDTEVTVRSQDI